MRDWTRFGARLRRFVLVGGLAGLALGGFMLVVFRHPAAETQAPAAPAGIPVTLGDVRRADVPVFLEGLGQVQAHNSVLVRARVDGMLMRFAVKEGQNVRKGDLIAEIDPRPYQATLDAALAHQQQDQVQLANAKLDLTRYASLAQRDYASRQQLDTQRALVAQYVAALAGDAAAIESAKLNLDFCYIKSPIDGRVGLRLTDPGNLVHANDIAGIVTITQIHPISVVFTLPQTDLPRVQAAMARDPASLPVLANAGDSGKLLDRGLLLTTDNAIDPATGTIRLKASFPNPHDALWPGQFINARLQLETLKDATTIPDAAVQHGPDGLYAYVLHPDGTVYRQALDVTLEQNGIAVIGTGVQAGQRVVVDGQSRLRQGVKVVAVGAPGPIPSGVPISHRAGGVGGNAAGDAG
ncbi:MAG: efflux RND transporter periplasmic adaptor subunit [Rhodospirillales bacterium]|nr:efflux RND transporter periplasmic adaptor subunit [Rhodospirillales bacterium]